MQYHDLLTALSTRWKTIALTTLVTTALALTAFFAIPNTYTSESELFVRASGSGTIAELQQGEVFAQARAQSYAGIVNTPLVLKPAIQKLRLDSSVEELSKNVSVSVRPATVIIAVSVDAPTAAEATRRAAAVGISLRERVSELDGTPDKSAPTVGLVVLTEATVPSSPSSPLLLLNLAMGLMAGAAIGTALALFKHIRQPRWLRPGANAQGPAARRRQEKVVAR